MPTSVNDLLALLRKRGIPVGYDRFTRAPVDVNRMLETAGGMTGADTPASDIEIIASHLYPSPFDWWFNVAAPITLGASAARSVVVAFALKPGMLGILRNFSTGVANQADWDSIVWAVEVSDSPIIGFDFIQGPISDVLNPVPLFWPLYTGQTCRVVATNLTASPITNVTAMLRGTTFPGAVNR